MSTPANSESLQAPVLLVILNHRGTAKQAFEAIRDAKPRRLYVVADGSRTGVPTSADQCEEARNIVEQVDWSCDVKTLFRETNVGSSAGRSHAFTWFFEQEEEGIILEDDCVPSRSFFWYCQELLDRYRSDHRVMHIGGNNFLEGWQKDRDYSYYFSRRGHVWGWATWRRAWRHFDFSIGLYPKLRDQAAFRSAFLHWPERFYWFHKFDETATSDAWHFQWDFARYINSGLAIVPAENLVRNADALKTGTKRRPGGVRIAGLQAHDIDLPLRHPPFVIGDMESDRREFRNLIRDIIFSKLGL